MFERVEGGVQLGKRSALSKARRADEISETNRHFRRIDSIAQRQRQGLFVHLSVLLAEVANEHLGQKVPELRQHFCRGQVGFEQQQTRIIGSRCPCSRPGRESRNCRVPNACDSGSGNSEQLQYGFLTEQVECRRHERDQLHFPLGQGDVIHIWLSNSAGSGKPLDELFRDVRLLADVRNRELCTAWHEDSFDSSLGEVISGSSYFVCGHAELKTATAKELSRVRGCGIPVVHLLSLALSRWTGVGQAVPIAVWQVVKPLIMPPCVRSAVASSREDRRARRPSESSACTCAPTGAAPKVRIK